MTGAARLIFVAKLVNAAIGFVTSILIARALLPVGRAEYFLVSTLAVGAFTVAHLSLDSGVFWAVAERRARTRSLLRPVAAAGAAATVAALGLYALVTGATAIADDVPDATVAWGAALVPAVLIRFLLDGLLWAQGRSRAASASLLLTALLQVTAIVTLAATDELDSAAVLAVSALSTVLGSLPGAVALARAVREEDAGGVTAPRELVRIGLQNHVGVLALWAALRLDVLVVAAVASERELGLYTLAVTLSELVLLATDSLALAALGEQGRTPREESGELSVMVASSAARVAALQAVVLMAVAWPGITLVYGDAWADTVPVVIAMAPGTVALAYMRPLGPAFIRADRSLTRSGVIAGSAAVNVVGALVLVPAIGIVGAGLATTAAYWLGALVVAWLVRTRLGLPAWRPA